MTEFAFHAIPWKYQSVGPYEVWRYAPKEMGVTHSRLTFVNAMALWSSPIKEPATRLLIDGHNKTILGEVLGPIYQLGMTEEVALWCAEFLGPDHPSWVPGFFKYVNGQED